jgi:Holliday junction DNA helicase RuvA
MLDTDLCMIAQLTGLVCARTDASCVIDVNGVGYLVLASTRTLAALGERATVFTEMQVREDAITLFGFGTADERDWFRLLTTVQGVGGRVALNVLSILSPGELAAAIAGQDKGALGRASGVGPKLAVRLVTELRDKVGGMPSGGGVALPVGVVGGDTADALSALLNLGYRRPEAEAALGRVAARLAPGAALDALLREALKELAR